jgi:hypothetical protein
MDVVGHQAIGMNRTLPQPREIAQHGQIYQAVVVLPETILPIVTALPDMQRDARHYQPRMPRHGGTTPEARRRLTLRIITYLVPN